MAANGGPITYEDLKAYKAVERQPLNRRYKGYDIVTAPPPSSGGIGLLQMLGVLEGSGYEKSGWGSAATIHYVAETMRRYYAEPQRVPGRHGFYEGAARALVNPEYIKKLRASIDPEHASNSDSVRPGETGGLRKLGNHAFFDCGQGRECSQSYLYAEWRIWQRCYGSRFGLSFKQ